MWDVEQNPGPKDAKYLSLCHWNLNSLAANDLAKVSALKAFNATEKLVQINNLPECLVCEVNYENKKIFIVVLYRFPSQNDDEFDEFLRSFEGVIDLINQSNL